MFAAVRRELLERFGGMTAYARAPAQRLWESDEGEVEADSIVVFEVMAERLDRQWRTGYRVALERSFEQDAVVIRAMPFERL